MREYTFGSGAGVASGGLTTASRAIVTLNTFLAPTAPAVNIEMLRHWVGQAANATSAQQRVGLGNEVSAFSAAAISVTPQKLKQQDTVSVLAGATTIAAGKCGINLTTEGAGAVTLMWEDDFNVLNGYLKVNTPAETEIWAASSATAMVFQFLNQPGTLTSWSWGQNYREI